jgi:hypothetical protein
MTSYRAGSLRVYLKYRSYSTAASILFFADRELGTLKLPLGLNLSALMAM